MMKDVMILTGAGQIGMAIARRMGYDKKNRHRRQKQSQCGRDFQNYERSGI